MAVCVAPGIASSEAGGAAAAEEEGDWTFMLAPYIFLPSMSGAASIGGNYIPIDATIGDLFSNTDFVFAIQAQTEAWYQKKWGAIFNGTWSVMEQKNRLLPTPGPADPLYSLKINTGYFEFFGAYDPFGEQPIEGLGGATWDIQLLLGFRVTAMFTDLSINFTQVVDSSEVWVDPLLGARGQLRFGNDNRWSFISRVDFGGFGAGSDFTWNFIGMFGYDFNLIRLPSTVTFGVRGFGQDYDNGIGKARFAWDVAQWGPMFGLAMHF